MLTIKRRRSGFFNKWFAKRERAVYGGYDSGKGQIGRYVADEHGRLGTVVEGTEYTILVEFRRSLFTECVRNFFLALSLVEWALVTLTITWMGLLTALLVQSAR